MPSLAEIVLEGGRLRSDALRRNAEIVANQQRNSGLLWGSLLSNTGNNIAQTIQHAQEYKAEAPMRAAQLQQQQNQNELTSLQLGQAKVQTSDADKAKQKTAAVNKLMGSILTQGEDGFPMYDPAKATKVFTEAGMADQLPDQLKIIDGINTSTQKWRQAHADAIGSLAVSVANQGYDPDVARNQIKYGAANGMLTADEAKQTLAAIDADPAHVKQIVDTLIGHASPDIQKLVKQPSYEAVSAGGGVLNKNTGVVAPGLPPKPANVEAKNMRVNGKDVPLNFHPDTGKYTDPNTGAEVQGAVPIPSAAAVNLQMAGQTPTTPIDASRPDSATGNKVDKAIGITPNALYQGGLTFALKGTLPAGSRSMAAMPAQKAIQNKAGALAEAAGVDLPQLQQEYAAASASTKSLTSRYQFTSTAAQAANENIAYALELSPTISRTDVPAVNRFTQWLQHETGGGGQLPQLSQFELALYTAAREYAKVTSGSAASISELSQTASQKVDQLINAAQTPDQFKAVTGAMQRDMTNIMGPMYRQLQNTNDVGPSLRKFMEFVGGGQGKPAGKKDSLGIR